MQAERPSATDAKIGLPRERRINNHIDEMSSGSPLMTPVQRHSGAQRRSSGRRGHIPPWREASARVRVEQAAARLFRGWKSHRRNRHPLDVGRNTHCRSGALALVLLAPGRPILFGPYGLPDGRHQ
jgi:hypothetical protein